MSSFLLFFNLKECKMEVWIVPRKFIMRVFVVSVKWYPYNISIKMRGFLNILDMQRYENGSHFIHIEEYLVHIFLISFSRLRLESK